MKLAIGSKNYSSWSLRGWLLLKQAGIAFEEIPLRFTAPEPGRLIGLAWRRTSPRKADFFALGQLITRVLETANQPRPAAIHAG